MSGALLACATGSSALAGEAAGRGRVVEAGPASVMMRLGAQAAAPRGFLDFCRRSPDQCVEADATRSQDEIRTEANRLYWATTFAGTSRPAAPAATSRASRDGAYDWSAVFNTPARVPASAAARVAASPRPPVPTSQVSAPAVPTWAPSVAATAPQRLATANPMSRVMGRYAQARTASPQEDFAPAPRPFATATREPAQARPFFRDLSQAHDRTPELPPLIVPQIAALTAVLPAEAMVEAPTPALASTVAAPRVNLDRVAWALVNSVNRDINGRIRQSTDVRTYGVEDYWRAPTERGARGDCEDYVLAKREALIARGIPAGALSIAVVKTRWGESHAVLLLASEGGEYVLDNLTPWISRWDRVDYDWQERQAPGKIFEWVRMGA